MYVCMYVCVVYYCFTSITERSFLKPRCSAAIVATSFMSHVFTSSHCGNVATMSHGIRVYQYHTGMGQNPGI